ncbi:hypothetical protein ACFX2J_014569 [Malus domestica]
MGQWPCKGICNDGIWGCLIVVVFVRMQWKRRIFFFECSKAFWFGTLVHVNIRDLKGIDFLDGWKNIYDRVPGLENGKELLQCIVFVLWKIWKCRNVFVFTKELCHSIEDLEIWRRHLDEFRDVVREKNSGTMRTRTGSVWGKKGERVTWKKLGFGCLKVKCEGAWGGKKKIRGEVRSFMTLHELGCREEKRDIHAIIATMVKLLSFKTRWTHAEMRGYVI